MAITHVLQPCGSGSQSERGGDSKSETLSDVRHNTSRVIVSCSRGLLQHISPGQPCGVGGAVSDRPSVVTVNLVAVRVGCKIDIKL